MPSAHQAEFSRRSLAGVEFYEIVRSHGPGLALLTNWGLPAEVEIHLNSLVPCYGSSGPLQEEMWEQISFALLMLTLNSKLPQTDAPPLPLFWVPSLVGFRPSFAIHSEQKSSPSILFSFVRRISDGMRFTTMPVTPRSFAVGISSDDTKYSALVANLDAETLSYVSDIVLSPPNSDKYHTLSQRLITQFSDSDTQKIKKLLTDLQLGDEKPSHLLRKMKELSNGQLQDDFLQTFLDKLAIIADKVVGASSTICAATTVPPPSQSSSCSAQPTMDSLARQIQELSLQVAELTRERNSSRHQRYSPDRRRSHSRSRSVNRGSGICYYHRRYKEQASKCVSPCAFVQKKRVSSAIAGMAEPSQHTSRLFLLDRKSGQKFLIDSGSEICVIPPSPTMNKSPQSNFSLFLLLIIPKFQPMTFQKSWSSPLHVVPKSDSTVRPVGDYRQLNSVTEFDSYPMPYLNDFAHALHGKKIFSKIDIFKAFHQIPIAERFLPKAAEQQYLLSEFLKGSKGKKDSKPLNWSFEAITAFPRCKQALADAALLAHPSPSAPLALHVDAFDYAIGGALHQVVDSELQPLAFFSRKLTSSEKSYSAYDRELLAIYSAIRHFRYMLEARDFTVFTDQKPLTYAFRQKSDKCSPRQIRQLDFITQFTTNIVHIPGSDNIAADVLSRVSAITITFPSQIDYDCIAETQQTDQELHTLIASGTSLELKR
ncbi:transposon Tf2-6 polyprotein [Trichonephila clavipes]|nr:transposon Tf2-6 polyprotein [Trichonephila clavipes]